MIKLALIGRNIQHSQSPQVYSKLLQTKIAYTFIDSATINDIPSLDELYQGYDGVSVTAPYKREMFNRLGSNISDRHLNSINCLYKKNGQLWGSNTDVLAIRDILLELNFQNNFQEIYVLGNGAMSTLLSDLAIELNLKVKCFNRQNGTLADLINGKYKFPDHNILMINACAREFIYAGSLSPLIYFWDLNYNMPEHSRFFNSHNIPYLDGMTLLEKQARYALKFWNLE